MLNYITKEKGIIMTTNEISGKGISKIIDLYLKSRDEDIKNSIFLYYYSKIDEKVDELDLSKEDKEDLSQDIKEYITRKIIGLLNNEIKITNASPYMYSVYIFNYITKRLVKKVKDLNERVECVSLNTIDVYSNSDLENKIINKVITEDMLDRLFSECESENIKNNYEKVKKYFGINCVPRSTGKIAKEYKTSRTATEFAIKRVLLTMYAISIKENKYKREQKIDQFNCRPHYPYKLKDIYNIKTIKEDMEYFPFYYDCDELSDTHILKKR